MPVTINGNGSITGLAVGGLPNGTVDADTLASNAVTSAKLANGAVTQAKKTYAAGEIIKIHYTRLTSSTSVQGGSYTNVFSLTAAQTFANSNMLVVTNISTYLGGTSGSRAGHAIFRDSTQLTYDPYAAFRDGGTYKNAKTTQAFLDTGISDTNNHTYSFRAKKEGGTGDDNWIGAVESGIPTPQSMYVMEIAG